ncbi:MAG TPA: DUF2157 domain-containing protein [Candidatus Nanoarchaeia archaeon]|nr:DUF2157 domain-containing protein [Candidatus Nanoarchaeia archaeon]
MVSKNSNPFDMALLSKESKKWISAKIISEDQAGKIKSFYRGSKESYDGHSSITSVIAIFGALMIGAGIILFFALNWGNIPKYVKVFSILAAMVATYHIGYVMKFSKGTFPKVGSSLIFLGSIIYGAGIILVMQIFHIRLHWPNGFLYWAAGIIPLAYLLGSVSVLYLGLIGLGFYVGTKSYYWFGYVERYYNISYAFFLVFLSLGVLYYVLGNIHQSKKGLEKMSYPFHLIGAFLVLLVTYLFSFKWFVRDINAENAAVQSVQAANAIMSSKFWIIFLVVSALAAISIIIGFSKRDKKSKLEFYELFFPAVLLVFAPFAVLFSKINFWFIPVLFNIMLFLLIIAMVYLGYAKKEKTLVNLGMFAFGVSVFSRYIEYLWDVLNGYIFFIIGGLLLIFLAIILEKNRRNIIKKVSS